jgi:hypothetical protein
MLPVHQITVRSVTVLAMLLVSFACSRGKVPVTAGHDAAKQKALQAAGAASTGFVCAPKSDGNFVCICKEGSVDPDWSCDGMSRFCDVFDHGDLCNPEGYCTCHINVPARPG